MCGICGAIALDGQLDPAIRAAMPDMTHSLAHRGPDGQACFADDVAALGHRRLAIIDRAGGEQPMLNEDGSFVIVFNGEIYNHRWLRRILEQRGHRFRTTSDTETILHGYEQFGPAVVDRLDGMFAFAIYDQRKREVLLARDRLGKKPLFYGIFAGVLHFASEMKALVRSPAWDGTLDLSSLEGYLSLGYFLAPHTVYRHVRKLEPGHWLRTRDGHVETRKYWDVERFDTDARDEKTLVGELEPLLRRAVHERLESEVPLGAFLSGGIDSGLVVSYMSDALGEGLVTTSVGFDDPRHNELSAATLTAGRFRTQHHAEVIHPRLDEVLDRIVDAFDEPFADSSVIPTYYVSEAARRHVTVALSGDGGDEVFGGYDFRYVPHALEEQARAFVPGDAGRRFVSALGARWPRSRRLPRALRLGSILENLGDDAATAYFVDLCFMKPPAARALLGLGASRIPAESPVFEAVTEPYRRCHSASAVQRAQYADLKIYLPNDVLVKVDRMSMTHGLEVRCPLLDHRIVEFAFRIPSARKSSYRSAKRLLRALARRQLPKELARLPKRGFTAPVGRWMAGAAAERFQSEVLRPSSLISTVMDIRRVRAMFDMHRSGRADHSYPLWAIWMLERWSASRADHSARPALTASSS